MNKSQGRPRSYDPEFEDRVISDMKAEINQGQVDPGLRSPETIDDWCDMLIYIISDSEAQFAKRKAEMAILESEYAQSPDGGRRLNELSVERARYSLWRRNNLAFHWAARRRLAEAQNLCKSLR